MQASRHWGNWHGGPVAQRCILMLPEHDVLFCFIIPHGSHMVIETEASPPPGIGWMFLQAGQFQAAEAPFPAGAKDKLIHLNTY